MPVAYSKKQQLKCNRGKPKRKQITAVTDRVYDNVMERSGGICEWCHKPLDFDRRTKAEMAHLVGRGQIGRGDHPWNIMLLCGPQVNTGTCHNKLDANRKTYRSWMQRKVEELKKLYNPEEWPA